MHQPFVPIMCVQSTFTPNNQKTDELIKVDTIMGPDIAIKVKKKAKTYLPGERLIRKLSREAKKNGELHDESDDEETLLRMAYENLDV